MAVFTSLLTALGASAAGAASAASTIGAVAGAVGTVATVAGTIMQAGAAKDAANAQKKQEQLREAQMNMDAMRERRTAVRQAQVARANAVSSAGSQGAIDSSGLAGGQAQISGQTGQNLVGINAAQNLGTQMFAANADEAAAQSRSATGGGVSSLGGALVKNQDAIGKLGANIFRQS